RPTVLRVRIASHPPDCRMLPIQVSCLALPCCSTRDAACNDLPAIGLPNPDPHELQCKCLLWTSIRSEAGHNRCTPVIDDPHIARANFTELWSFARLMCLHNFWFCKMRLPIFGDDQHLVVEEFLKDVGIRTQLRKP